MNLKRIAVFGPSKKFLSGVSYYTIHFSNALSEIIDVNTVLFRNMLPKRLFPGWRRVGEDLTKLEFNEKVKVFEILDWYDPFSWIKAYHIAKQCDALIFQWWTSSVAHMYFAIEILNKLSAKKPVVIEFHEVVDPLESSIIPIKIYSRVMGRLIRRLAYHYVVHSESDRKLICEIYGIPDKKISIIPHGIYDQYRRVENAKKKIGIDEDFAILFFGLLRPYKGVKYLIKAFEMLPVEVVRDSRLLIVGETWEDKDSVKLAKSSIYRDKITVVNRYVSDEEISLYFSASDVLVLPYTRASQSGVAHIAMALGLPIIASKVGGLEEALSTYDGTYFVNPKDVEDIKNTILKVYKSRTTYLPPQNLKWSNIAKRWVELIESLHS